VAEPLRKLGSARGPADGVAVAPRHTVDPAPSAQVARLVAEVFGAAGEFVRRSDQVRGLGVPADGHGDDGGLEERPGKEPEVAPPSCDGLQLPDGASQTIEVAGERGGHLDAVEGECQDPLIARSAGHLERPVAVREALVEAKLVRTNHTESRQHARQGGGVVQLLGDGQRGQQRLHAGGGRCAGPDLHVAPELAERKHLGHAIAGLPRELHAPGVIRERLGPLRQRFARPPPLQQHGGLEAQILRGARRIQRQVQHAERVAAGIPATRPDPGLQPSLRGLAPIARGGRVPPHGVRVRRQQGRRQAVPCGAGRARRRRVQDLLHQVVGELVRGPGLDQQPRAKGSLGSCRGHVDGDAGDRRGDVQVERGPKGCG
jgi:hypothetical protein